MQRLHPDLEHSFGSEERGSLEAALQQADISKRAENLAQADELARPYL